MIFKLRNCLKIPSLLLACLVLSSCVSVNKKILRAESIAQNAAFKKELISEEPLGLITFSRIHDKDMPLRVYIEGDGHAYSTRTKISNNPTPDDPLALKLAAIDTYPNILYIARPYQYFNTEDIPEGASKYWSSSRFALEVINSVNYAINKIKDKYGLKTIVLIGYSGGGTIVELVAAEREDVRFIITVAGNLDVDYHTKVNKLNPLTGSLNPADYGEKLRLIPQIHFVGLEDRIITSQIAESFRSKINPKPESFKIIKLPGYTHHDGWVKNWRKLLSQYLNDRGLLGN